MPVTINGTSGITTPGLDASGTNKFATTIGVGGATPSASGAGITFPATQSASTNANTLDDYEEGTWTPAFLGESSTTYTRQNGRYCKIGRTVTVQAIISWSAFTPSGNLRLQGLPFDPDTSLEWTNSLLVGVTNSTAYSQVMQYINATAWFFYTDAGSIGGSASANPFGSSGSITVYGTYFTGS